jgi:hypothetical protein
MAFAVNRAAANPCQYKVRLFRIVEIYVDFDAAERCCHLIHDPRDEVFEFER